jgi:hypothetical protein
MTTLNLVFVITLSQMDARFSGTIAVELVRCVRSTYSQEALQTWKKRKNDLTAQNSTRQVQARNST